MRGKETGSVDIDQLSQDVIYSIAGTKDELWLGRQQGGLTRLIYRKDRLRPARIPSEMVWRKTAFTLFMKILMEPCGQAR